VPNSEDIRPGDIRYDCRHYTGYKPCGRGELCAECERFEPRGFRILIIKLGAMGDVVRTLCLLPALRARYSPCHITWITAPESLEILRHAPGIDRRLAMRIEDILALELEQFDLLMNFDKDAEALALAARTRAADKRGFAPHPQFGTLSIYNEASLYALRLGLSDELKFRKNTKTVPEIVFEMAELPYRGEEYALEADPRARARAAERFAAWEQAAAAQELDGAQESTQALRGNGASSAALRVVAIYTGCGDRFPTKQWTVDGFCALIQGLLQKSPAATAGAAGAASAQDARPIACMIVGGPREREFNAEILRRVGHPRLWDAGCGNSIADFLALLERCDCVVSSDSLGMHFAIALRRPVVALFGPTAHREVGLFGRGEIIATDLECAPCYLARCPKSPSGSPACMEALAPERVMEAVRHAIQRT